MEERPHYPTHLQETRLQGTLTFPCTMYFASAKETDAPPFDLQPHWHDAVEILHLIGGTYSCGFNTHNIRLEREAFCFVEKGTLHSMQGLAPYEEEAVVFDPALLLGTDMAESTVQLLSPLRAGTLRLPLVIQEEHGAFPMLKDTFQKLRDIFLSHSTPQLDQHLVGHPGAQLRIKACLLELFAILYEMECLSPQKKTSDPRLEALKQVMVYIRDHYTSKIYLKDLAQIMNMNEQYFCRFFKKALGKSPIAYIKEMRIKEASLLLESTGDSISSIASRCGFTSTGHFVTEFKKTMGLSPAHYRNRHAGKE